METHFESNFLAREIARERTMMRREPVVLEDPTALLRSVLAYARNVVDSMERVFAAPLEQMTFCTYHPAECGGIL